MHVYIDSTSSFLPACALVLLLTHSPRPSIQAPVQSIHHLLSTHAFYHAIYSPKHTVILHLLSSTGKVCDKLMTFIQIYLV